MMPYDDLRSLRISDDFPRIRFDKNDRTGAAAERVVKRALAELDSVRNIIIDADVSSYRSYHHCIV